MAKNDFYVVACVILEYLYTCLRDNRKVDINNIDYAHMDVSKEYWDYILNELYENGYIKGCISYSHKTGKGILLTSDLNITLKGIDYLQSNTMMLSARKFLSEAKGWAEAIAALLNITYTIQGK